jgi:hypothetical protein
MNVPFVPSITVNSTFTVGDFDGDGRLDDLVVVRAHRFSAFRSIYNISIRMGSGVTQDVSVIGPSGGFELIQTDLTGNQTPDLVLAAPWLDYPLAVLINMDNGKGTFLVADPASYPGANAIRCVTRWECQSTSLLHLAAISSRRSPPSEVDAGARIAPQNPSLDSSWRTDCVGAGRRSISSLSSRGPPILP